MLTVLAISVSVYLVSLAARTLPIGTTYAVWVGMGAVGAALIGMFVLGESRAPLRIFCLSLIVAGVVGLKLVDG